MQNPLLPDLLFLLSTFDELKNIPFPESDLEEIHCTIESESGNSYSVCHLKQGEYFHPVTVELLTIDGVQVDKKYVEQNPNFFSEKLEEMFAPREILSLSMLNISRVKWM